MVELMVVMVLTGLVITIGGWGYRVISKQFSSYQTSASQLADANRLSSWLQQDLSESKLAYMEDEKLILQFRNRQIIYEFLTDQVNRISNGNKEMFQLSVSITELSSISVGFQEILTKFELRVNHKKKVLQYHYNKTYGADVYIHSTQAIQ